MFEEIAAAFPIAGRRDVIFSWGDRIYTPGGVQLTPALKAHEAVHGRRQGDTDDAIRGWWRRYLDDPIFRLAEEVVAHRAEYQEICGRTKDRNVLARELHAIAGRLASPLYGLALPYSQARHAIVAARQ